MLNCNVDSSESQGERTYGGLVYEVGGQTVNQTDLQDAVVSRTGKNR